MVRLKFPKEPKTFAVPPQKGVGRENQKRFCPVFHAGSEEEEPQPLRWRNGWLVNLAVRYDPLLPEQSIFGEEVGITAWQVGGCGESSRMMRRLGETQESPFES